MGSCRCGRCVGFRRSQIYGGTDWWLLSARRWWNGLGVIRWSDLVAKLRPEPDGIRRCPYSGCRDELRDDGSVRHAQPQLQLVGLEARSTETLEG